MSDESERERAKVSFLLITHYLLLITALIGGNYGNRTDELYWIFCCSRDPV